MGDGRMYWLSMTYGCSGTKGHPAWPGDPDAPEEFKQWREPRPALPASNPCWYELGFLLEEGCEGPGKLLVGGGRGKKTPGNKPATHTPSGRLIVPVPFVAGLCPYCKVGELVHVRWQEDKILEPMVEGPLESAHFAYPTESEFQRYRERACGRPVYFYSLGDQTRHG